MAVNMSAHYMSDDEPAEMYQTQESATPQDTNTEDNVTQREGASEDAAHREAAE
jgi:hypothetical protein